ncbi:MAG: RES domain-containing protein [Chloroflexi bacterium]|nr:RES domain-containing protein [Chloroflexota bacterium]
MDDSEINKDDPLDPFASFSIALSKVVQTITQAAALQTFSASLVQMQKVLTSPYLTSLQTFPASLAPVWNEIAVNFETYSRNRFAFRQELERLWKSLEEELCTSNRYFPKSELLNMLEKYVQLTNCRLRKGSILYRARKITINELPLEVRSIINIAQENYSSYEYRKISTKAKNFWEYVEQIDYNEWVNGYMSKVPSQHLAFWGVDASGSDAPPSEKTEQGRINPMGISYLYTARNAVTAIAEVQPSVAEYVSVASVKILKSLKIFCFDFNKAFQNSKIMKKPIHEIKRQLGTSYIELKDFFDTISELFSKAAVGDTKNYYVTQYISEFVKNKGFDGIEYKSSLKKMALTLFYLILQNIVMFNPITKL